MFWLCWMSSFTLPVITWFNILMRVFFYILSFQGFFRSEKLNLFFFPSESWMDKNIKKALDNYSWGFSKLKLSKITSLNFSVKSSIDSLFFEEDYPWEASLILFFPLVSWRCDNGKKRFPFWFVFSFKFQFLNNFWPGLFHQVSITSFLLLEDHFFRKVWSETPTTFWLMGEKFSLGF